MCLLLTNTNLDKNDRVGGGFWRRGGETPSVVQWEDRVIEIREGSWSYVAGSIGKAPGMLCTCIILLNSTFPYLSQVLNRENWKTCFMNFPNFNSFSTRKAYGFTIVSNDEKMLIKRIIITRNTFSMSPDGKVFLVISYDFYTPLLSNQTLYSLFSHEFSNFFYLVACAI